MGELMVRNLADLDVAVLMIDGLDVAGSCAIVCGWPSYLTAPRSP